MRIPPSPRRRSRPPAPPLGLPGPDSLEHAPRHLQAGATLCRTLLVTGYPAEVSPGWLEPLTLGPVDISVHITPVPTPVAAERLRRQRARLEASRRYRADHGHLTDHAAVAAAEDADELALRLARGHGRLFRVGLYVRVRARTLAELDAETDRVQGLLASRLLDAHPATWRHLQGWTTTLPLGLDLLGAQRTLDTRALAAAFPFASPELPLPAGGSGILYGRNLASGGLVGWDRFAPPGNPAGITNPNSVILAKSGAGKSYLAKLEALRWLYQGVPVAIIDPEDEYRPLAEAVGGSYLPLGRAGVRLNPFDLDTDPDALTRRILRIFTLVSVLLGRPLDPHGRPLDPPTRTVVDRAVRAAYAARGIHPDDPRTHTRPAPLLDEVAAALAADPDALAQRLAAELEPYTTGSYRLLFDGPTSTPPDGHLVVFSLRDLPDELKAAGTLLVIDAAWRLAIDHHARLDPAQRPRRLLIVDEAWLLARDPAGAHFLDRMARGARKHHVGLTTITQDAADMLASPLGRTVITQADTKLLLGQAPPAIPTLGRTFALTEGERAFLTACEVGQGILAGPGGRRVAFAAQASPAEHALLTAHDPQARPSTPDAALESW